MLSSHLSIWPLVFSSTSTRLLYEETRLVCWKEERLKLKLRSFHTVTWKVRIKTQVMITGIRIHILQDPLFNFPRRESGEQGAGVFLLATNDRTHGSSTKRDSDITNFSVRLVKYWNSLPREAVDIPYLSLFKRHLNNALNNML